MNIEAYNLDTLRKLVRDLQKENKELRALLQRANVPCAQSEAFLDMPAYVPWRSGMKGTVYRIHKTYTVDRKRRRRFEDVPVIVVDPEVVVAKTDEDGCPVFLA